MKKTPVTETILTLDTLRTVPYNKPFTWARRNGYEVSSVGDKRFSAFFARMHDGRSLECHYHCDVKGYDPGGTNWKLGKGKPPLDLSIDLWGAYLNLWEIWASDNYFLMLELAERSSVYNDRVLSDCFANSNNNQAHALSVILNKMFIENQ